MTFCCYRARPVIDKVQGATTKAHCNLKLTITII